MRPAPSRQWFALIAFAILAAPVAHGASEDCFVVEERPGCRKDDPQCDPATPPVFVRVVRPDGSPCTDGTNDRCLDATAGTCQHALCVLPPKSCAALDSCHTAGTCDPATGQCSNPAKADGAPCNDGDLCRVRESCAAGVCQPGAPVVCSGPQPACGTPLGCDAKTGACVSQPSPDDTSCDDGNACTRDDRCASGACVGTDPLPCNGRPAAPGDEVAVNLTTIGNQYAPAACRTVGGQLITVWAEFVDGDKLAPSRSRIVGRRYRAADGAFGGEFRVDTAGVPVASPDVACAANGSFVVVWSAQVGPTDTDVFARRYSADATPLGDPFTVNAETALVQGGLNQAAVAGDADGNFVVVWSDLFDTNENVRVSARRFAADGSPRGGQFVVNTSAHSGSRPDVAVGSDGDFVVAWTAATEDDQADVLARRFTADGTPRGDEGLVNRKTTDGRQGRGPDVQPQGPAVALLTNGDAVVAWTSDLVDPDTGVAAPPILFVQRVPAVGLPAAPEMQVEDTGFAAVPDVAAVGDGFVVTWTRLSLYMASPPVFVASSDVWARRFAADSRPIDAAFRVNRFAGPGHLLGAVVELKGDQPVLAGAGAALAGGADGAFAVAWESAGRPAFEIDGTPAQHGQDGDRSGIYLQRFLSADDCRDTASCDPATGQCGTPRADGTACDDGDACTSGDQCAAGACNASPVQCPASACHDGGLCDPRTGACVQVEQPDGTRCEDGNLCTFGETCQAGACASGAPRDCSARDLCHQGSCDTTTGQCVFAAKPDGTACEDANHCTAGDTCRSGACTSGVPVVCAAAADCQDSACIPKVGCTVTARPDGTACSDGNQCSVNDRCAGGRCAAGPALICGGNADPCRQAYACDPQTGACASPFSPDGTPCNDGDACTRADQCRGGACGGSPEPACAALTDALACWVARPLTPFNLRPYNAHVDEFGAAPDLVALRPAGLCEAAGLDGGPLANPALRLGCYDVKTRLLPTTLTKLARYFGYDVSDRTLVNRFGVQSVRVLRPRGATGESVCTPLRGPDGGLPGLPRHRCYTALPALVPKNGPLVTLKGGLGGGTFRLGALQRYCTPAGAPGAAPAVVLACYALREDRPPRLAPPDQKVSGDFGAQTLRLAVTGRTLCVPSALK
ncbi:MAG: hypothetical protein ACRERC_03875 [Candidatus Binatia bacterium]